MGSEKTKTIVQFDVAINTQRILPNNNLNKMQILTASKLLKNEGYGLRNGLVDIMNAGSSVFTNYYNFSKWYSPDRLPECTISGIVIPKNSINNYLMSKHNITNINDLNILSYEYRLPYESEWIKYYLAEHEGFNTSYDIFIRDGKYYSFSGYTINDNNVVCKLKGIQEILYISTDVISIIILSKDDTLDIKNTLNLLEESYLDKSNNNVLYVRNTEKSLTSIDIPKDSEKESMTRNEISRSVIDVPDSTDTSINIPLSPKNNAYIVKYEINKVPYSFVYFPHLGKENSINQVFIPTIGVPEETPTQLVDAMPITVLRNNYFNIDEYDAASPRYIPAGDGRLVAYKSEKLTKERYKQVEYILNGLNLTVDDVLKGFKENPDEQYLSDAFVVMGITPNDRHHIVSKFLYETIIYFNDLIGIDNTQKSVYFSEEPYNVNYSWTAARREVVNEIIGKVGTYSHEVGETYNVDNTTVKGNVVYTDLVKGNYHMYSTQCRSTENGEVCNTYWIGTYYSEYEEKYYYTRVYIDDDPFDNKKGYYKTVKNVINTRVFIKTPSKGDAYETRSNLYTEAANSSPLVLKKQITNTKCDVIWLYGFSGQTIIGRSYTKASSAGISNDNFIIPLFTSVYNKFTPIENLELLERSLRFVMYCAKLHIDKIKYYDYGIFQTFITIIGIVITAVVAYFTWGTGAAPTASVFFSTLATSMAIGVAVQVALQIIVQYVSDPYLKAALMAITVIVGAIASYNFTNISMTELVLMTGVDLLNTANIYLEDMTIDGMKALQNKIKAFNKERTNILQRYEDKLKEYEDILKKYEEGITTIDLLNINKVIEDSTDEVYIIDTYNYYDNIYNTYTDYDLLYTGNYDSMVSSSFNNMLQKRFN